MNSFLFPVRILFIVICQNLMLVQVLSLSALLILVLARRVVPNDSFVCMLQVIVLFFP